MTDESTSSTSSPDNYYTAFFDALPSSSLLLKPDGAQYIILAATPLHLKHGGKKKDDVVGKELFTVYPGKSATSTNDSENDLRASLQHSVQNKEVHRLPIHRYDVADDKGHFIERYWQVENKPVFDPGGAVAYVLHSVIELTDQVKAQHQQEIIKSMEQTYRIFMQAPFALHIFTGSDFIIELANAPTLEMWGRQGNVIGKPFLEVVPEVQGQGFAEILLEVMETGKARFFYETVVLLNRAGKDKVGYFNFVFQPFYKVGSNQAKSVLIIAHEVTDQVLAKKRIDESEQRFRKLADESPIFIFIIDSDALAPVSYWNKTWLEYTGQSAEEAFGRAWDGIIHADDVPIVMNHYGPAFQSKQAYFIPAVRVKRHDGIYRWHSFKGNPRYLPNGDFNGYVGVGFDVHEQKLNEEGLEDLVMQRTGELQRANKELQRSNQLLEEFAHAASHDLKEPIRKIHIFTNQLKQQLNDRLNENEAFTFSRIQTATERMKNLIDDLLLYSHVSQRLHQPEAVDLNVKVQQVLEDLELDIQERGAVITVGELPIVQGYERQLQQLLQNLISNALKYSKADEPPHILINAEKIQENKSFYQMISVKDNGIGFAQQYGDQIFKMFARLHDQSKYSGTGIGLSIVKRVVENHAGFIRVRSEPEVGSIFEIYLPV